MHFLAGHGAQIDQKPELVLGVELLKSHELGFFFFFHEEAAHFTPNVSTFDAVVVQYRLKLWTHRVAAKPRLCRVLPPRVHRG